MRLPTLMHEEPKKRVSSFMEKVSKTVRWIHKMFDNPHVRYAAESVDY